jgi:hypothetical protein
MKLTFTKFALVAAVALSLIAATVITKVSDYPRVTTPGTNDLILLAVPNPTNGLFGTGSTNKAITYANLKSSINQTNVKGSGVPLTLPYWTGTNTLGSFANGGVGSFLGINGGGDLEFLPTGDQPASANLSNWSALATSAKQPASPNLTNWSAIATNAMVNGTGSTNSLAIWSGTNLLAYVINGVGILTNDGAGGFGFTTNLQVSLTISNISVTNLTAQTINITSNLFTVAKGGHLTVTNYVQFPWTMLAYSGSNVTVNLTNSMFRLTLTNNAFFAAPTGLPGTNLAQTIQVHLLQDGTGGRTVTLTNSAWVVSGSGVSTNAVPTINTNANGVTILTFVSSPFDATKLYGVPSAFTP